MSFYRLKSDNTYYYRIRIPQDLQKWFSVREIKKSLKTTNKPSARLSANHWQSKVDNVFTFIRSGIFSEDQLHGIILRPLSLSIVPIPQVLILPLFDIATSFVHEQILTSKWTDQTKNDYRQVLNLFTKFACEIALENVDCKVMVKFMECLCKLPANIKKKPEYRNLKLRDIAKLSRR